MKLLRALVLATLLVVIPEYAIAAGTKADSVATLLDVITKVYDLSGKSPNVQNVKEFDQRFLSILHKVNNPDTLKNIAIICDQISRPGRAGDESIDEYFDRCFFLSASEIAKLKGLAAQNALEDIARRVPLDGAAKLDIDADIIAQKRLGKVQ